MASSAEPENIKNVVISVGKCLIGYGSADLWTLASCFAANRRITLGLLSSLTSIFPTHRGLW
jgi:hypothetical protein